MHYEISIILRFFVNNKKKILKGIIQIISSQDWP